ncbi:unnamed protein product, partial [Urochloa humidicola]
MEKLVCVVVTVLAVLSPLYIDRRPPAEIDEEEEEGGGSALLLPALLLVLILAINVTCFMDRRVVRFDPYWIHRAWGSSGGLLAMLMLLGFVLKYWKVKNFSRNLTLPAWKRDLGNCIDRL